MKAKRENITQISDAVKNGLPCSVKLSDTNDVEATVFKRIAYVVFKKGFFYINAAFEERSIIKESIPIIFLPVCGFIYTAKDVKVEIFKVISDGTFPSVCYSSEKTVAAQDDNSMVHKVEAYLIHNKLKNILKEDCYGCQCNCPSQIERSLLGIFGRLYG